MCIIVISGLEITHCKDYIYYNLLHNISRITLPSIFAI